MSCLTFTTLWTVACQAPISMGFPSKNTGVDCHFLSPGDLSDPGKKKSISFASPALAGGFFTTSTTKEDPNFWIIW